MVFLHPNSNDLQVMKFLLDFYGHASGLHTNLCKSSASPIHGSEEDLQRTTLHLACNTKTFPCQHLGLPLTIRKPSKDVLLPLIDKVADHLPGWKAPPPSPPPLEQGWSIGFDSCGTNSHLHLYDDCLGSH